MAQKHVEDQAVTTHTTESPASRQQGSSTPVLLLVMLALVLCILVSVTPLHRFSGTTLLLHLPTNIVLLPWGTWLPSDLHLTSAQRASQLTTSTIEFLLLMGVAFILYGVAALLVQRSEQSKNSSRFQHKLETGYQSTRKPFPGQPQGPTPPRLATLAPTILRLTPLNLWWKHVTTLRLIWLGAIIIGLIFVLAPAMPSHDIFVYAGYGRTIAAHGANPYFMPLSAFPQDPFNAYDDWRTTTAAYGPVWLALSTLFSLLSGDNPLHYVLAFRVLAFACHLVNIWLVSATLRGMGRPAHTVTLGTLLYAWNPLVLLESCLGGHNDVFMVTLLLLGIFLSVRAERRGITSPWSYLPPVLAFTLAALVKFTTLPLILFFLVLLVRKSSQGRGKPCPYYTTGEPSRHAGDESVLREDKGDAPPICGRTLPAILIAAISSAIVALLFYVPFWIGHSIPAIVSSFSSPPSARFAFKSILHGISAWNDVHPLPGNPVARTLLSVFGSHSVWNDINIAALLIASAIGAVCIWRVPSTRTLALVSLGTLGTLLVLTPWFFPWYLTWIVGLAAVCLPLGSSRVGRALLAFTLTFSASSLLTYLFNGYPPMGGWMGFVCLTTIGPPLLAFGVFLSHPLRLFRAARSSGS